MNTKNEVYVLMPVKVSLDPTENNQVCRVVMPSFEEVSAIIDEFGEAIVVCNTQAECVALMGNYITCLGMGKESLDYDALMKNGSKE